jgi:hypothetical protein
LKSVLIKRIQTSSYLLLLDNCLQFDPIRKHLKSDVNENGWDDELDRQVEALPFSLTKRYGEIVFAQGGTGYGWWPCQIYDPRRAIDPNVRQAAHKHLHTRFLVYFFNCTDLNPDCSTKGGNVVVPTNSNNNPNSSYNHSSTSATGTATPFSILAPKMIKSWVVGLSEDLFFGRAAKNHGKQRYRSFCDAFQLACIEFDKSINNSMIDQQHRCILNNYVYPKVCIESDHNITVSDNAATGNICPTPEKKFQESFLLPSPRRVQTCPTMKNSDRKEQKGIKKRQRNGKIDWIRLPSKKRQRPNVKSTPKNHSSTHTSEGNDYEDDDIPHPAFADFTLPKNSKWKIVLVSHKDTVNIPPSVSSTTALVISDASTSALCYDSRKGLTHTNNESDDRSATPVKRGCNKRSEMNTSGASIKLNSSSNKKVKVDTLPKKRLGRPKKLEQSRPADDVLSSEPPTKNRGRPKKKDGQQQSTKVQELSSSTQIKRGRPRKVDQYTSSTEPPLVRSNEKRKTK